MGCFEAILANTVERQNVMPLKLFDFVVSGFAEHLNFRRQNSFATESAQEQTYRQALRNG
tara:strand:- start:528 stop:707 length:180 start_codon:yes stop_codon:yes gene_type:complete